jgi:hypothetical protein
VSACGDAAVFERYLSEVMTSVQESGTQVRTPRRPQPTISPNNLERVLNDPRLLFPSPEPGEPRKQLILLYTFALWLRYSPSGHVPRHLESRAARLRFGIWSLAPRMGWPPEWDEMKVTWSVAEAPRDSEYTVFSPEVVLAEARVARDDWLAYLKCLGGRPLAGRARPARPQQSRSRPPVADHDVAGSAA